MKKLFSWNVNGFRSIVSKGALDALVEAGNPDILCLQETKLNAGVVPHPQSALHNTLSDIYPHQFWHIASKPGYSGTALLSKAAPRSVAYDFAGEGHAREGRVITAEFERAFVVTAYVPNSQDSLARLPYRMKWDADFRAHLVMLTKRKPVFVCGDFNCAHEEIDLANPDTNHKSAGFSDEERASFSELLAAGFVDTFRENHPDAERRYTWWSFRTNARARNVGWRIDYWLASRGSVWTSPQIHDDITGSDHCPVSVEADI